jgi:hypothetical protein
LQGLRKEVYTQASEANPARSCMNIIHLALDMVKAVESFAEKAKKFFYSVMLLGYRCPKCNGLLVMAAEGRCRCTTCRNEFDPTVTFQTCPVCGGVPMLNVRWYECKECHGDIRSKFLFDGLIFNAEYFRQKVAESRQRRKELKERVCKMLAESRSANLPLQGIDLSAIPGLTEALNSLTSATVENFEIESRNEFNLKCYEDHIQAHIQDFPVTLEEIPPLSEKSGRKDLIWRFIGVVFLDYAGVVDIWQEGQDIMVIRHEANRQGCDLFRESEEADGIERSVGRAEAG